MSPADGPERIGDLLADAARRLGVEAELQLARAAASWAAIVAERVPEAASASRLVRFESGVLV
ncbi:MAG TPA: hypothetical protein VNJ28_09060, partial [Candidatus Limnocylindrales bacterium]|nr:hypothetical protein [Candidatus Limnocylindrales bacterium]